MLSAITGGGNVSLALKQMPQNEVHLQGPEDWGAADWTRSVLDCGSPLPLFLRCAAFASPRRSHGKATAL